MSDFKRLSPIQFAAISAVSCGLILLALVSLIKGGGQFVWDWEVAAAGGLGAMVGAVRAWKDAKHDGA